MTAEEKAKSSTTLPQEALEAYLLPHHESIEWAGSAQFKPIGSKAVKVENRYVVVTQSRIHTFSYSPKPKGLTCEHIFNLREIKSATPHDITLGFSSGAFALEAVAADLMIPTILNVWRRAFPGLKNTPFKMAVEPADRIPEAVQRETSCGALSAAYDVCANFLNVPFRDDIAWDIDRIIHTQNLTRLALSEFETLAPNDIRALLLALRFNTFFKTLDCNNVQLGKDKAQLEALIDCVKGNITLETLSLKDISAKSDFWAALFTAMSSNRGILITDIDLSLNQLDSQGFVALSRFIEQSQHGLVSLNLQDTHLDKNGTASLTTAFRKNIKIPTSLTSLNLAHNKLDPDGSASLSAFLSNPNALTSLNLRQTNVSIDTLVGALLRGCQELRRLDLSGNKISSKAVPQLIQWIKSSSTLKSLNISATSIPAESFRDLVATIGQNCYLEDITLKAAENEFGEKGGVVLAAGFDEVKNIKVLDLSDNTLGDEGLAALAETLILNEGVHSLDLSGNLYTKSKHSNNRAIECLIALLESECPLESLALRGSKTNQPRLEEMLGFIYAVGVNDSLLELDISNNNLGFKGAVALGKVLQTNKTLQNLTWDDNATPISGFQAFQIGLSRNRSLKTMPLPMNDISLCAKENPLGKDFGKLILDIQACISRNENPAAYINSGEMTFSMMGGLMLSTGHQATVDAQIMKIKRLDVTHLLDQEPYRTVVEDTQRADKLSSQFQLIREETQSNLQIEMNKMLKDFASQVSVLVASHKGQMRSKTVEAMTESLKSLDAETIRRLGIAIEYGSKSFDQTTLEKILVSAAGVEIMNKAVECFSSATEVTSEYMYEKLLDSLDEICEQIQLGVAPTAPAVTAPAAQAASPAPASIAEEQSAPSASPRHSAEITTTVPASAPTPEEPKREPPKPVEEEEEKEDEKAKQEAKDKDQSEVGEEGKFPTVPEKSDDARSPDLSEKSGKDHHHHHHHHHKSKSQLPEDLLQKKDELATAQTTSEKKEGETAAEKPKEEEKKPGEEPATKHAEAAAKPEEPAAKPAEAAAKPEEAAAKPAEDAAKPVETVSKVAEAEKPAEEKEKPKEEAEKEKPKEEPAKEKPKEEEKPAVAVAVVTKPKEEAEKEKPKEEPAVKPSAIPTSPSPAAAGHNTPPVLHRIAGLAVTPPKPGVTPPRPPMAGAAKPASGKPAPPPRPGVFPPSSVHTTIASRPSPPPGLVATGAVAAQKAAIAAALSKGSVSPIPGRIPIMPISPRKEPAEPQHLAGIMHQLESPAELPAHAASPMHLSREMPSPAQSETHAPMHSAPQMSMRNLSDKKALLAATFARAGALGMRPGGVGPRASPLSGGHSMEGASAATESAMPTPVETKPAAPAKPRAVKKPEKNSVLSKATATPSEPTGPALTQLTKDRAKVPHKAGKKGHGRRPPTRVARPLSPSTPTTSM